jgi:hypothetical protein
MRLYHGQKTATLCRGARVLCLDPQIIVTHRRRDIESVLTIQPALLACGRDPLNIIMREYAMHPIIRFYAIKKVVYPLGYRMVAQVTI